MTVPNNKGDYRHQEEEEDDNEDEQSECDDGGDNNNSSVDAMWNRIATPPPSAITVDDDGGGEEDAPMLDRLSIGDGGWDDESRESSGDATNSPPRLVYQSSAVRIHRIGRREGVKSIRTTTPSNAGRGMTQTMDDPLRACYDRDAVLARIERERRMTDRLPPRLPARRIASVVEEGGSVTVRFEWVMGIPLEEWASRREGRRLHLDGATDDEDLRARLRAAVAVAGTLRDYHDVHGVAHGGLDSRSVLLETRGGRGEDEEEDVVAAYFVDLSRSTPLEEGSEEEDDLREAARRKDLGDLGRVFRRLFGGVANEEEKEGGGPTRSPPTTRMDVVLEEEEEEVDCHRRTRRRRSVGRVKRGKSSSEQDRVVEELPLYLSSLISALLANDDYNKDTDEDEDDDNDNDTEIYSDARSLLSDLTAARARHGVYFRPFDWKEASLWNHLPVPENAALYGRLPEAAVLANSWRLVADHGRPMMTVVGGHAGMGKSTLVKSIKESVEERKGSLIRGKFDMADGSRPDSVLFKALDSYFRTLMAEEKDDGMKKARMRQRIINRVGFGMGDLIQSIPNLGKLVPNDFGRSESIAMPSQLLHRSKFLLCKLIGAIADADNPIAMVMGDLHWADATSLSIIQTIVTDPDIQYCLYVGCYRDNEISSSTVEKLITNVKSQGINVFTINLGPLGLESVNTLISESMCLPPSLSQPLSAIIHSKTGGSPLFCVNFLCDGLIRFNMNARRWEYHKKAILMIEIPLSVVQYMKSQMAKLPLSYRLVLKLASCLGHYFKYATFLKAKVRSDYDLDMVLPHVCQIGLLYELTPRKYMWAHDQVRLAAYELIPENMRESFHLLIGTRILMNTLPNELDTAIFDILRHMNKGIRLIQTPDQRHEVAQLNLMAGQSCIKTSSFHSAADYFTTGIKLLSEDCWEREYDLTLKLHDAAQDAVFATGDFPTLGLLNSKLIANARNFEDTLKSHHNLIRYLVSLRQHDEAIRKCKIILNELGEPIPDLLTGEFCLQSFMTVGKLLGQHTGQDILALHRMTDTRKLAAMDFLQIVVSAANNSSDPRFTRIFITRMVKISLEYGLCDVTPFAFVLYGSMLVHGQFKDIEGGCFYGGLGTQLSDLLEADRFKARVFTVVYGFVNIWRDPFQASLDKLLEGYDAGCVNGDMEYAYWNLQSYSGLALYTGQSLAMLQVNMRTYVKRAIQCKQLGAALGIVPFLYAVLELTGEARKEDIYETFFNTTSDILFQQLNSRNDLRACMLILNNRKFTCIFTGDVKGAVQAYEASLSLIGVIAKTMRTMPYIIGIFADGLIALACARKHGEDEQRWTTIGEGVLETLKTWAKISSRWNFINKCYLLEAEYNFLKCNEMALEKYEASISAARSHRYIHEEGLAFFLCAQYHLIQGRKGDARQNFTLAKKCYERWGAQSLAEQMGTVISSIA